jgi:hypothetical protein
LRRPETPKRAEYQDEIELFEQFKHSPPQIIKVQMENMERIAQEEGINRRCGLATLPQAGQELVDACATRDGALTIEMVWVDRYGRACLRGAAN